MGQEQNNHATLELACHGVGWFPGAHRLAAGWRRLSPSLSTSQLLSSADQHTPPPGVPLMSDQHFHYNLTRAGQVPITETDSQELDWTTSDLRQLDGTEDTGNCDDFNTVAGSLADNSTFTRYGF